MAQVGRYQAKPQSWILTNFGKITFRIKEPKGKIINRDARGVQSFTSSITTSKVERSSMGGTKKVTKSFFESSEIKMTLSGEESFLRKYFNDFVNGLDTPEIEITSVQGTSDGKHSLKVLYTECELSFDDLPMGNNETTSGITQSYTINASNVQILSDIELTDDNYSYSNLVQKI